MIDKVIEICEMLGVAPIFAMMRDGNVVLDGQRAYPIMVWPFDESITLQRGGIPEVSRSVELYFAYTYGDVEGDVQSLMPLVEDATQLVAQFITAIENAGISCTVGTLRPTVSKFDSLEAGVMGTFTFSYRNCCGRN